MDDAELMFPIQESSVSFVVRGDVGATVEIRNPRIRYENRPDQRDVMPERFSSLPVEQPGDTSTTGNSPVELSVVIDAWKRREESSPKLDVSWVVESGIRCAVSSFRSDDVPAIDAATTDISRLVVSPDSIRYSTAWRHPRMDLSRKAGLRGEPGLLDFAEALYGQFAMVPKHPSGSLRLEIGCDDERRIDELYSARGEGYRGIAFERPDVWKDRVGEMDDLLWRGALLAFRPLAGYGIGCQPDECNVHSEMAWFAGLRCFVIEEVTEAAGSTFQRRFWVDPLRDFLVLRATVSVDGMLREQLDTQYTLDSAGRWLPVSWGAVTRTPTTNTHSVYQFPGDEWMFQVASAKVVKCQFDGSSSDKPIAVNFRPGTVAIDRQTNEWIQQVAIGNRRRLDASEAMALTIGDKSGLPESSLIYYVMIGTASGKQRCNSNPNPIFFFI